MKPSSLFSPIHIEGVLGSGSRAVFLDRDGVVNIDHGYVGTWDRFDFTPGAIKAIKILNGLGYRVIVVTNQSGIARGYYTQEAFARVTARMLGELTKHGARVDAVYACPHFSTESKTGCSCRKPEPGMILAGLATYGLSAASSILVGDKPSDIIAARAAGIGRCVLVSAEPGNAAARAVGADEIVRSLDEFAQMLAAGSGAMASAGRRGETIQQ